MTIREQIRTTLRALAEIPAVVELVREGEQMRRSHVETALRLQLAKKQAHIERLQCRSSKCGADVTKALRDAEKWRNKCHEAEVRAGEELAKNIRPNGKPGTWQETVDDLRSELGPARALIAELNNQLDRLREQLDSSEQEAKRFLGERDAKRQLTEELALRITRTEQLLAERTGMLTDERERSDRLANDIGLARVRIRELETHITEVEEVRDSLADVIKGEKKTTIADLWQPIGGSEWLAVCSSSDRVLFGGGIRWPSVCRPIERGDDRTHYILLEPPR